MYHRKLQNQIDKLWLPPLRQPVRTHAVLLADSKCFNLQQQVKVNPESLYNSGVNPPLQQKIDYNIYRIIWRENYKQT